MARKEAIFKLEVDSGEAVKDIKKLDQDMTHLAETIGIEVSGSISAMEDKLYELALTGQQNTKEFKELQIQVAKYKQIVIETDRSIDQLAEQGRGLSSALSLAEGTVAGFQAFTGVTALLGDENEELLETITKLEASQGVLNSIMVLREQLQVNAIKLTQAQSIAQNLLNKALGEGSKASKLLRGALLATGVGALVIGIGLLIQNFDKLKGMLTGVTKEQKLLNDIQKQAVETVAEELSASDKLSKKLNDETLTREQKNEAIKDLQETYPNLLSNIDAETATLEEVNKALDLNTKLLVLRAQLEALNELRTEEFKTQLKQQADAVSGANLGLADYAKQALGFGNAQLIANQQSENAINKSKEQVGVYDELTKGIEANIEALIKQGAVGEKETKANEEANAEAQKLADEAKKRREEERKALEEQARLVIAMRNELLDEISRIEDEQFFNEREKAINAVNEKYFDLIERTKQLEGDYTAELKVLRDAQQAELKKLDDQFLEEDLAKKKEQNDRSRAFEKELEDLNFEIRREDLKTNLEQLEQLEIDALKSKYERTIEEILANEQLTEDQKLELIKANKLREEQEIELIQEEFRARRKEADELEAKEKEERFNNYISGLQSGLTSIGDLTNTLLDIQIENAEKGSAKELALQKKKFEINKKLQIAQAVMQGIQAVQAAFTSGVATPIIGPATGAVFAGIAGVISLANIAKIKAQKFEGGTGSIGGGGGGSSAGLSASNLSIGTGDDLSSSQTFLNADGTQQGGTTKVVVLESDISNKQDTVKQIETKSTF